MKKMLAIVMCIGILTGCTAMVPSPHGEIANDSAVQMYTQFPVYDKDIDRIQVMITNNGENTLEYGTEWAVEKKQRDGWVQVPFIPDAAWTQPLLTLSPGGTYSYYVSAAILDYTLQDGEYRVVKEISGAVYAAEFSIGESDVSADSPFGYAPLEELPMEYSVEDAVQDGVVIVLADGKTFYNTDRLAAFLEDAAQNVDTQIRFGYTHRLDPEKLVLEDVILTKATGHTPRFTYRTDSRRISEPEEIQTKYYSYLILEGEAGDERFILTNGATERHERKVLSVPSQLLRKEAVTLTPLAEEYLTTRYHFVSAWSPDGMRHVWASPDLLMHFYVNIQYPEGGSMGYTVDLLSEKIPQTIQEFVWIDETTLFIVCSTKEAGLEYFATYDTDKQENTHWSTGRNGYVWSDGKIVIPD